MFVKREDLQVVRSYKVRGAYTVIDRLDPEARARGVVCASAGNHGQGLAYACAALGVHGRVFLPRNTPRQKRDRIATIGGDNIEVIVVGDTYDDANAAALADAAADRGHHRPGLRRPVHDRRPGHRGHRDPRRSSAGCPTSSSSRWAAVG